MAFAVQGQTVDQRRDNQQARVAQGVNSGQLTPGETAKIEGREAKVNHEVRRDRAANGGTLKPGQQAKVQHQLNRDSRVIAKDKHNAVQQ